MYLTPFLLLIVKIATAFLTDTSKQCFNLQSSLTYGPSRRGILFATDNDQIQKSTWMDKNKKFTNEEVKNQRETPRENKTFREDFRGTRVFVKNIPDHVGWQDLKDHFKIAGEVVFASISKDQKGEPKGHGIVQFGTTDDAMKAIRIMRDYPIDGSQLFVREDVQEKDGEVLRNVMPGGKKGFPTPPSKWKCADEEVLQDMSQEEYKNIRLLIKERDKARFHRNYPVSDKMREELKYKHSVHLDDGLKLWWVSNDGKDVPQTILEKKGDGRWNLPSSWRQIPTTPESDACVNPELVERLLQKRDKARRKKDFTTADALLEEARTCPDDNLCLLIHDESRTWRIWTDSAPPQSILSNSGGKRNWEKAENEGVTQDEVRNSVADTCISLVTARAPKKVEEVRQMLKQFPGREKHILRKLQQKYK